MRDHLFVLIPTAFLLSGLFHSVRNVFCPEAMGIAFEHGKEILGRKAHRLALFLPTIFFCPDLPLRSWTTFWLYLEGKSMIKPFASVTVSRA